MKLHHLESNHQIEVDDKSGLLTALTYSSAAATRGVSFDISINLQTGGGERRAATGGLEYFDCQNQSAVTATGAPISSQGINGIIWHLPISIDSIKAELIYRLDRQSAAASFAIFFPGGQSVLIRDINLEFQIKLPADNWVINMPGNGLRKDLPISTLNAEVGISPVGGLRGSSSVIHLASKNNGKVAINQKPGVRGFIVSYYNTFRVRACIVNPDAGYRGRGAIMGSGPIMGSSLPGLLRRYLFLQFLRALLPGGDLGCGHLLFKNG